MAISGELHAPATLQAGRKTLVLTKQQAERFHSLSVRCGEKKNYFLYRASKYDWPVSQPVA
jgi:hypothetical protein